MQNTNITIISSCLSDKPIEQLIKETEETINAEKVKRQNVNYVGIINKNNMNNKATKNKKKNPTLVEQLGSKVEEINRLRSDIEKHKQQYTQIELEKELQVKTNGILNGIVNTQRENVSKLQGEVQVLRERLNTESGRLVTTRNTDSILKLNQSLEKEANYTKEDNSTLKRSIRNLERQLEDKKDIISNLRNQTLNQTPDERSKNLQDENALLRESNGDLEQHLIDKIQDIAGIQDENQLLKKAISELERKLISNEDDIQNTSNENQMLKQKINNVEEQLMGKERETGSIKDENRLLKESIQYLEQRLNNKTGEAKRLDDENHSLTKSTQDLEHQLKAISDAKKEESKAILEGEARRLKDENTALKQAKSRLDRQLTDKEKEHRACKDENRLLKKSNETLDRELYDNENKIKSMVQQIKQKDNHITTLKKDKSHNNNQQKSNNENQALKQKIKEHENTIHALKAESKTLSVTSDLQMTNRMIETMESLLKARTNEMELLKQNMSFLLDKEKEKTARLEREIATLKDTLHPQQMEPSPPTSAHKADEFQNMLVAKTEENVEIIALSSCQISNKKRKMVPNIDI
jgi:chromosome segregation ATPase